MLAALKNIFEKHLKTAANKWRRAGRYSRDAELVQAYSDWQTAEADMLATADPDTRDIILECRWAPAYAAVCLLPARTPQGLRIKMHALLTEHEDGASEWGDDLCRTSRVALGLPTE